MPNTPLEDRLTDVNDTMEGILDDCNMILQDKGASPVETLADLPSAIENLSGGGSGTGGIAQVDTTQGLGVRDVIDMQTGDTVKQAYVKPDGTTIKFNSNGQLQADIKTPDFIAVAELPTASAQTMGNIYLVPSSSSKTKNVKDEYITVYENNTYDWEQIGTTAIDLSNYYTKSEIATVGTTGDYDDLLNKPTIPPATTVDSTLSATSTNPVQNKVITEKIANLEQYFGYEPIPGAIDFICKDSNNNYVAPPVNMASNVGRAAGVIFTKGTDDNYYRIEVYPPTIADVEYVFVKRADSSQVALAAYNTGSQFNSPHSNVKYYVYAQGGGLLTSGSGSAYSTSVVPNTQTGDGYPYFIGDSTWLANTYYDTIIGVQGFDYYEGTYHSRYNSTVTDYTSISAQYETFTINANVESLSPWDSLNQEVKRIANKQEDAITNHLNPLENRFNVVFGDLSTPSAYEYPPTKTNFKLPSSVPIHTGYDKVLPFFNVKNTSGAPVYIEVCITKPSVIDVVGYTATYYFDGIWVLVRNNSSATQTLTYDVFWYDGVNGDLLDSSTNTVTIRANLSKGYLPSITCYSKYMQCPDLLAETSGGMWSSATANVSSQGNLFTTNWQYTVNAGDPSIATPWEEVQTNASTQSDWNQSDSTAVDFIKNKPTIPSAITVDSIVSNASENPVQNKVLANIIAPLMTPENNPSLDTINIDTEDGNFPPISSISAFTKQVVGNFYSTVDDTVFGNIQFGVTITDSGVDKTDEYDFAIGQVTKTTYMVDRLGMTLFAKSKDGQSHSVTVDGRTYCENQGGTAQFGTYDNNNNPTFPNVSVTIGNTYTIVGRVVYDFGAPDTYKLMVAKDIYCSNVPYEIIEDTTMEEWSVNVTYNGGFVDVSQWEKLNNRVSALENAGYLTEVTDTDVNSGNATSGLVLTTDGSGGASWASPTVEDVYSQTEEVVGTWIDGKPIYRVVQPSPIDDTPTTTEYIVAGNTNITLQDSNMVLANADLYAQGQTGYTGTKYARVITPLSTGVGNSIIIDYSYPGGYPNLYIDIGTTIGGTEVATINKYMVNGTETINLHNYASSGSFVYLTLRFQYQNTSSYHVTSCVISQAPDVDTIISNNKVENKTLYINEYTKLSDT